MHFTNPDFLPGKLKSLHAQVVDKEVVCFNSRAGEAMKDHYSSDKFPILTYKDPLGHIWLQHVHSEDHSCITETVMKSRRKFRVIRARNLQIKNQEELLHM